MWKKKSTAWKIWEKSSATLTILETGGKVHALNTRIGHYNTGDVVYGTMVIGGLCMGQEITSAFYNFDIVYKQQKLENRAKCVMLTGVIIIKLLS